MAEKEAKKEFVLVPRISLSEFVQDKPEFNSPELLAGFKAYVGKEVNKRPAEWEATMASYLNRDGRNDEK